MRMLCVVVVSLWSVGAWAQCSSDTECPAGGTCNAGACITPSTTPATAPTAVAPVEPRADDVRVGGGERKHHHWAGGAAAIGFAATGPVVASGILSMFFVLLGNSTNAGSAVTFTLLTMVLVGALGPVVELGAGSARFSPSNSGAPAARIIGWVCYGLSLAAGLSTLGLYGLAPSSGVGFFTAFGMLLTGGVALLLFGVDAVASGSRANASAPSRPEASGLRVMPGFALAPGSQGQLHPVLGLTGLF